MHKAEEIQWEQLDNPKFYMAFQHFYILNDEQIHPTPLKIEKDLR